MSAPHEEWLEKAEDDLRFAKIGFREEFFSQVCFLSQQAIEKCLKGALVFLRKKYPRSHNLRELAKLLPEISLASFMESLTIIDSYYVPLRYPDAAPGMKASGPPNRQEAAEAMKTAEEIWNQVNAFTAKN